MKPANPVYLLVLWDHLADDAREELAPLGLEPCPPPHGIEKHGRTWATPRDQDEQPRKTAKAAAATLAPLSFVRGVFFIDHTSVIQEGAQVFTFNGRAWTTEAEEAGAGFFTLENVTDLCAAYPSLISTTAPARRRRALMRDAVEHVKPGALGRYTIEQITQAAPAIIEAAPFGAAVDKPKETIADAFIAQLNAPGPTLKQLHELWHKTGAPANYAELEARAIKEHGAQA